jgi:SAM-dependent MidA family methyltransferase
VVAIPWSQAWQAALYGRDGFYRREAPSRHFATAAQPPLAAVLAEALWRWADRLGMPGVVEIGAGRGELLGALHAARPDRPVLGCDVVVRPDTLAPAVGWLVGDGGDALPAGLRDLTDVLVVAHEWLDVVPCDVAEVGRSGRLRLVHVDPGTGDETLGKQLGPADAQWCQRWWPTTEPGHRVEIGRRRDLAWAGLLSRVRRGAVLAVDYGHDRSARPPFGTLRAYRGGNVVRPVPDGTCDLTASVAVDSLRHDRLLTHAEALAEVGLAPAGPTARPAGVGARAYLSELEHACALAELGRPEGYGRFRWVLACLPGRVGPARADWPA